MSSVNKILSCSQSNHAAPSGFQQIEMCIVFPIIQKVCGGEHVTSAMFNGDEG